MGYLMLGQSSYLIDVDSIFLNSAVPEIFYFKHHVGASLIIIFIRNPDVPMPQSSPQRLISTYNKIKGLFGLV